MLQESTGHLGLQLLICEHTKMIMVCQFTLCETSIEHCYSVLHQESNFPNFCAPLDRFVWLRRTLLLSQMD